MKPFEKNLTNMFADGKELEQEIMSNLKGLKYED